MSFVANFVPTRFKWVIITNSDYEKIREIEKFSGLQDIPEA